VKQRCYPTEESFTVTDTLAEVKLQDLLDHTILRIVQAHEIILTKVAGENIQKTVLVSKWGSDGSTGHGEYKQMFYGEYSDSDFFLTSLVLIQLFTSSSREEYCGRIPAHRLLDTADPYEYSLEKRRLS
jgi:hypothetical protein